MAALGKVFAGDSGHRWYPPLSWLRQWPLRLGPSWCSSDLLEIRTKIKNIDINQIKLTCESAYHQETQ